MTTVTILSGLERRRRWSTAEKLRIVEESLAPAARVVEVARRHDIHPNLLTLWRRQARSGALGCGSEPAIRQADKVHFAAVSIAPGQQALMAPSERGGAIEIGVNQPSGTTAKPHRDIASIREIPGNIAKADHAKEENLIVTCDFRQAEEVRRNWPFLRDRRIDAYGGLCQLLAALIGALEPAEIGALAGAGAGDEERHVG